MPGKFSMKDLYNNHSKAETITAPLEAGNAAASGFVLHDIPINSITPSSSNFYGMRDIEELAASIEEMGLLHNLVVRPPDTSGKHEIVSGERRWLALKLLGWEIVPCKIEAVESEAANELRLIFANSQARIYNDYEKMTQAARVRVCLERMKAEGHKFKGRMREIVADILKVSPAQVGRMESIDKHLSPEWKAEFEAGNVGISAAYDISTATPDEQAAGYVEYKESGLLSKSKHKPPETSEATNEEEDEAATQNYIGEQKRRDAEKAPTQAQYDAIAARGENIAASEPPEDEAGELARVQLIHHDGQITGFSGDLAIIAAVNAENEHGGDIAAGEGVTDIDYIVLAKVVTEVCLAQLADGKPSLDKFYSVITDAIEAAFDEIED